ncbi:competence/damage-inducible protein A [Papillibacter cinnamivorans]|uniref:Putative competence-damage inducible protein n=1 Tax=Papillibacter cinnamivorans DSM 12816 TaxID=1122930 RepID=A0A1W2CYM9_9FIRM|nr:competence/damage-inducible protein A [Papillibacter cinnamivorans]SMC90046.1 nicotinamide-nucleotide amidase [Papillibacter cinnamivorans DSM 12816]
MSYTAEILGVGTELLLGNIANTDAQMISEGLSALGINVYFHTVVGDNPPRLKSAVDIARSRADIIITTGGLGPTCDDLTKQVLAEAFGKKLIFHEPTAERIRSYFKNSIRTNNMTENNLQQAMLPEGCEIFENAWGTAPGCAFESGGKHVLMLPGPPMECRSMFINCAIPYLRRLSSEAIVSRAIRIFGIGESAVEDKLRDMMVSMSNPTLAPYAKEGEVMLRVTAKADNEELAVAMMEPVIARVRDIIGDRIYGIDVDTLENTVFDLLKEQQMTVATAESCTGGLLAKRLTDIPGSSAVFKGSVVAYASEIKNQVLGVPKTILEEHGAVSRPVAIAMAASVRRMMGADLAVAITGVAGPAKDERDNPVGTVFVALSAGGRHWCRALHLGADRSRIRIMSANHALDMIRRYLTGVEILPE